MPGLTEPWALKDIVSINSVMLAPDRVPNSLVAFHHEASWMVCGLAFPSRLFSDSPFSQFIYNFALYSLNILNPLRFTKYVSVRVSVSRCFVCFTDFPHPSASVTHHFMSKFPLGEQECYLGALESSIPVLIFGLHSYTWYSTYDWTHKFWLYNDIKLMCIQ